MEASWSHLGLSWGPSWLSWRHFGGFRLGLLRSESFFIFRLPILKAENQLSASRLAFSCFFPFRAETPLESIWGPILVPIWHHFPSPNPLKSFLAGLLEPLRSILGHLRRLLGHLRPSLVPSWEPRRHFWGLLGVSQGPLGAFAAHIGGFWARFWAGPGSVLRGSGLDFMRSLASFVGHFGDDLVALLKGFVKDSWAAFWVPARNAQRER